MKNTPSHSRFGSIPKKCCIKNTQIRWAARRPGNNIYCFISIFYVEQLTELDRYSDIRVTFDAVPHPDPSRPLTARAEVESRPAPPTNVPLEHDTARQSRRLPTMLPTTACRPYYSAVLPYYSAVAVDVLSGLHRRSRLNRLLGPGLPAARDSSPWATPIAAFRAGGEDGIRTHDTPLERITV